MSRRHGGCNGVAVRSASGGQAIQAIDDHRAPSVTHNQQLEQALMRLAVAASSR
jgi:hypothetical protein